MAMTGRCYCGEVRYEVDGAKLFSAQCHCRECQYFSGGGPNYVFGAPAAGFRYTRGEPKAFTRSDLDRPATREFCGTCGTHIRTLAPHRPELALLKTGTLDDPSLFGTAQMAIYLCDRQAFHSVPEGIAAFDKVPG